MTTDLKNLFIQPEWPAPASVKAFTSLRQSQVGEHQAAMTPGIPTAGNIDRARLKQLLQLPSEAVWLKQIHSNISLNAIPAHHGNEADASYASEANQVCAVLTADCLPVLLCDKQGKFVAAIHAGWRGLASGVIENTLKQAPVPPEEILAWLGPAIGPEKFEVREDVVAAFTKHDSEAIHAFKKINDEQWLGNLYLLARQRLNHQGITQIYGGNHCTHTDEERFYSYRREKPQNGRKGSIVSVIWLSPS